MIWKVIKEYPNYSISNIGIVKRNNYTRIDTIGRKTNVKEMFLKGEIDKDGYYRVALYKNKKVKLIPVHRLVAEAFIENGSNLPCINHKNENKLDNNVNNLEFCTIAYNNSYGTRLDRVSKTSGRKIIGYDDYISITFNSANEAGIYMNGRGSNISQCANGNLNTAYGYKWRWA